MRAYNCIAAGHKEGVVPVRDGWVDSRRAETPAE
jgi:hypothetical protein